MLKCACEGVGVGVKNFQFLFFYTHRLAKFTKISDTKKTIYRLIKLSSTCASPDEDQPYAVKTLQSKS